MGFKIKVEGVKEFYEYAKAMDDRILTDDVDKVPKVDENGFCKYADFKGNPPWEYDIEELKVHISESELRREFNNDKAKMINMFSDALKLSPLYVTLESEDPRLLKQEDGIIYTVSWGKTLLSVEKDIHGHFDVPEGTNMIGIGALSNRLMMTSVKMPLSMREIARDAFAGSDLSNGVDFGGTHVIRADAFKDTKLRHVTIPCSVDTIGKGAFSGSELKSAMLPNSIDGYEASKAFDDNVDIKKINLSINRVNDLISYVEDMKRYYDSYDDMYQPETDANLKIDENGFCDYRNIDNNPPTLDEIEYCRFTLTKSDLENNFDGNKLEMSRKLASAFVEAPNLFAKIKFETELPDVARMEGTMLKVGDTVELGKYIVENPDRYDNTLSEFANYIENFSHDINDLQKLYCGVEDKRAMDLLDHTINEMYAEMYVEEENFSR